MGGVIAVIAASVLIREHAGSHAASQLIASFVALLVLGIYVMIAPLVGWWPWSSGRLRFPMAIMLVLAIVLTVVLGHGGNSHASRRATGNGQPSTNSPSANRRARRGSASSAIAPSSITYRGIHFTIQTPAGWTLDENEVPKAGELESTWTDGASPSDKLLIDFSPATDLTLQQDAAPVHRSLQQESDYRQVDYGPGDLRGVPSWMIVFDLDEREHVDYFFTRCSTSFAVLGSSTLSAFDGLRSTFRAVAESVRANC